MSRSVARQTVLQVVADGNPGGGTTAVLGLCDDLTRFHNWRVVLVSSKDSYALRAANEMGLETAGIDFFSSRFDLSIPWRLDAIAKRVMPSVIHVHGARAGLPVALAAAIRRRAPAVYTVHGFHFPTKATVPRRLGALAEKFIARTCDAVTYVSEGDQRIAHEWGLLPLQRSQHRVVYNGIEPDDFDFDSETAVPVKYDIAFVGRLVKQKNPMFMIDIMKSLAQRNFSLVMVGGGELEEEVCRYAELCGVKQKITFLGGVDHASALAALRASRVLVIPSLWEGLPIATLEASLLGLPIVASQISGTDEVVLDGYNGFTVPNFDANAFAEKISSLLDNPALASVMGAHGRSLVRERFQRNSCTTNYLHTYSELLGIGALPSRQAA